ncbi:MAG: hypothetical protein EXR59_00775 [Dehalococcoidia bacterium]|nr:hypothetical protein [Dehalococcoidia bacterium]
MNVRLTILLLIALIIAAPVGWVYGRGPKALNGPKGIQPFKFYSLEIKGPDSRGADRTVKEGSDRIESVRVSHLGQTVKFVKDETGDYHFDTSDGTLVDAGRWGGITLLLAATQAKRVFQEPVESLEAYGLAEPLTILDIETSGIAVNASDITGNLVVPSAGKGITGTGDGGTNVYIKVVTVMKITNEAPSSDPKKPQRTVETNTVSGTVRKINIPQGATNSINLTFDGVESATEYKVYIAKADANGGLSSDTKFFLSITLDPAKVTNIVGNVEYKLEAVPTTGEVAPSDARSVVFGVQLGDKTPDGANYYVQWRRHPEPGTDGPITIDPQIWLVDATWGDVLARLVTEPPYPGTSGSAEEFSG